MAFAGGIHDPVAAMVLCQPTDVDYSVINGKVVVENGHLTTLDLPVVLDRHNQIALKMVRND